MASNTIATTEGQLSGVSGRFTLVVGRWNSFVVEHLLEGAIDTLKRHGINEDQLHIVRAPGAFEIPMVCQAVAKRGDCDAIIALGAVIRGGTPHFEHVAGECTKGIAQVSLDSGVLLLLACSRLIRLSKPSNALARKRATKALRRP